MSVSPDEFQSPERSATEELSLTDIAKNYRDRWVAILVTERDGNRQPKRGKVVADDVDRYRLREKISKYKDVCVFYAGDFQYPLLF